MRMGSIFKFFQPSGMSSALVMTFNAIPLPFFFEGNNNNSGMTLTGMFLKKENILDG